MGEGTVPYHVLSGQSGRITGGECGPHYIGRTSGWSAFYLHRSVSTHPCLLLSFIGSFSTYGTIDGPPPTLCSRKVVFSVEPVNRVTGS